MNRPRHSAPARLLRALSVTVAACGLAASPAAEPTASFKFPTQTLTVPAGFTVELVAAPPLVNRPISIAFDERGRLYATDSSGLSDRAPKQFEEKPHRVVRLEDADGDGRFERATVFADRMMFPQGAMFYEGSLYVAAPPHLWKLTDTDGDGRADERTAWWDGKTLTGCANDAHGPYLGPDGWFYWTKGAFAEQKHTLGNGEPFVTRAAHIWRARPDGSGFEPVLTGGMDNPVGVAFTSIGERFLSGTFFQIPAAGRRDGLIHAIYGGVYGKENAATTGHPRTGDLMPIMTHMGAAAPCGSTTYRSEVFGRDYFDNLFVCYFNLRKIVRHQLIADGASFRTRDVDFVTSDSGDFRPTDVLEDADGSLLVVDTGGWYKICCPTSQLSKPDVLGGIYRIRRTGSPAVPDPRGRQLAWEKLDDAGLARLLDDPRPDVRDQAMHRLGRRGAAAVPALATAVQSPNAAARRNAIWTLARIDGSAARAAVRPALRDADASVVHTALQVTSLWRDAGAFDALVEILARAEPARARLAAETLGRLGDARAAEPLLAAARRIGSSGISATGTPEDNGVRAWEHAIIHALITLGRPAALQPQLKPGTDPRVARVALVALDQMNQGGLVATDVVTWLTAANRTLKQTTIWVVSHRPEWGDALTGFYTRRLDAPNLTAADREELQTQLAQLAKSTAIQELLAVRAAGGNREVAQLALRAMTGAGLKETPTSWLDAVARSLAAGDAPIVSQAAATARVLPLPKTGARELASALVRAGRNSRLPAEVRLDALAATPPAALAPIEAGLFDFLRAQLDGKKPVLTRSGAAAVLARAPLSPAQQLQLADTLPVVGALEAPKLLPAFERGTVEALGLRLIAGLKQSPGLAGIRAGALQQLFARYPQSVQHQAAALITSLNADVARQNARVDELLRGVKDGDVRRGQELFTSERTACTLCHVIGYRGGRLGPDLTNIGRIRNERELLEAILYPSATLVRGYEPMVVTTKGGETVSGILRKDAADEVILATGPETEQRIARPEITDMQPGPVSPMPPGMEAILAPRELADLVAFLKSRQ